MQTSEIKGSYDKEALRKYSQSFVLRKRKNKSEKQLENTRNLYVIYARKSTEDDQRQVQSIEDQIEHCKKYAKENGLEIADVVREEKSAKTAGKRPQFQRVLDTIQKGDFYNSILAWHPDRLSRNMKESGEILDMLDNDVIVDLKFSSYTFNNDTAGKMTLSILFAMAKEFSDKLSDDTKRGIHKTIKEGKHCGSDKRGYYKSREGYFREDNETFELYSKAWSDYLNGKSQQQLIKELNLKGENVDKNSLSNFFKDPFYAGYYCYGDLVVDMSVDPKFKPMVSPGDFLKAQKISSSTSRGWNVSDEFRPFREFLICRDCGNYMTPGVSKGKGGQYLGISCGNSKCKEKRKEKGIKPISNTVRSNVVIDFVKDFIKNELKVNRETYNKAKEKYLESKNSLIAENNTSLKVLRSNLTKLQNKEEKTTNRLLDEKNQSVAEKLSNDCKIIINQRKVLEKEIEELNVQNKTYEAEAMTDFPEYESFLNFFENIVTAMENTDDMYLIDQLVKLVFLNITVGDKKVLDYKLNEPFNTYNSLKFLSGVEDGT